MERRQKPPPGEENNRRVVRRFFPQRNVDTNPNLPEESVIKLQSQLKSLLKLTSFKGVAITGDQIRQVPSYGGLLPGLHARVLVISSLGFGKTWGKLGHMIPSSHLPPEHFHGIAMAYRLSFNQTSTLTLGLLNLDTASHHSFSAENINKLSQGRIDKDTDKTRQGLCLLFTGGGDLDFSLTIPIHKVNSTDFQTTPTRVVFSRPWYHTLVKGTQFDTVPRQSTGSLKIWNGGSAYARNLTVSEASSMPQISNWIDLIDWFASQ